jgi:hypothetical protein
MAGIFSAGRGTGRLSLVKERGRIESQAPVIVPTLYRRPLLDPKEETLRVPNAGARNPQYRVVGLRLKPSKLCVFRL